MPIVVVCPGCRKRYEVDASLAGKKSRCKLCGEVFRLPVPEGKVIETATQPKPPPSPQRPARESFLDNQAPVAGDSRASAKGAFERDPWHKRRQTHQRELPRLRQALRDRCRAGWKEVAL